MFGECELTTSFEAKVGPAVVEIVRLGAHLDRLHLTHLARCGTQFLEVSCQLHHSSDEGSGYLLSKAFMLTVAERADGTYLTLRVKFMSVGDLCRVTSGLAL